jgi:nucleoid DNA-binding protein
MVTNFFLRAARKLFRESRLELGGFGKYDSEDRQSELNIQH